MTILEIADEIYRELDSPDDIHIPSIVFWIKSNIGYLNNLLSTSIVLQEEGFSPELTEEQKIIFKFLYQIKYLNKKIRDNLGATAYDWSEISEGDSRVRRVSKNEIAKTYLTQRKDMEEVLDRVVFLYKQNKCTPECVNKPFDYVKLLTDPTYLSFLNNHYGNE
jgi:hypothetical protein